MFYYLMSGSQEAESEIRILVPVNFGETEGCQMKPISSAGNRRAQGRGSAKLWVY